MSEALDFVKNFEDLIKNNEVEQAKLQSLKNTKIAIEIEITALIAKKHEIEKEIDANLKTCDTEINLRKSNFERSFEQERQRIEALSKSADKLKVEQIEIDRQLRQREGQLNERQRLLDERELKLNQQEIESLNREEQVKLDNQAIATARMEIKREWQSIADKLKGIEEANRGINSISEINKQEQVRLRALDDQLRELQKDVADKEKKLAEDNKIIEQETIRIAQENKIIEAEKIVLNKQRKDNLDKENALKAMQVELDFKIAKLKREYEKISH